MCHADPMMLYLSIMILIPLGYSVLVPFTVFQLGSLRETLYYYACRVLFLGLAPLVNTLFLVNAIWHMDDLSWGKTRTLAAVANDLRDVVVNDNVELEYDETYDHIKQNVYCSSSETRSTSSWSLALQDMVADKLNAPQAHVDTLVQEFEHEDEQEHEHEHEHEHEQVHEQPSLEQQAHATVLVEAQTHVQAQLYDNLEP
jgi:hypothetical protein